MFPDLLNLCSCPDRPFNYKLPYLDKIFPIMREYIKNNHQSLNYDIFISLILSPNISIFNRVSCIKYWHLPIILLFLMAQAIPTQAAFAADFNNYSTEFYVDPRKTDTTVIDAVWTSFRDKIDVMWTTNINTQQQARLQGKVLNYFCNNGSSQEMMNSFAEYPDRQSNTGYVWARLPAGLVNANYPFYTAGHTHRWYPIPMRLFREALRDFGKGCTLRQFCRNYAQVIYTKAKGAGRRYDLAKKARVAPHLQYITDFMDFVPGLSSEELAAVDASQQVLLVRAAQSRMLNAANVYTGGRSAAQGVTGRFPEIGRAHV